MIFSLSDFKKQIAKFKKKIRKANINFIKYRCFFDFKQTTNKAD